jgi:hypothetical protein
MVLAPCVDLFYAIITTLVPMIVWGFFSVKTWLAYAGFTF